MAATEKVEGIERQNREQRRMAEQEGNHGRPKSGTTSVYVNLTIRRDEYHRIPYFI